MHDFLRDDDAAGLVEYALILGIIAVAVILSMIFLRSQLLNLFSFIGNNTCKGSNQTGACP